MRRHRRADADGRAGRGADRLGVGHLGAASRERPPGPHHGVAQGRHGRLPHHAGGPKAAPSRALITGSLPGQEADNPAVMTSHNLAALCANPASAPAIVPAPVTAQGGAVGVGIAVERIRRAVNQVLRDRACEFLIHCSDLRVGKIG